MAVANYHSTYHCYPPAFVTDSDGQPMHSWRVLLLPFLERNDLYERYHFDEPWDSEHNRQLFKDRPNVYGFHGESVSGFTNYLAVVSPVTAWPGSQSRRDIEITDGTTNTLLIIENKGSQIPWTAPRDLDLATMNLSVADQSPQGVSSVYRPSAGLTAAGFATKLPDGLSSEQLRSLLTVNGNEPYFDIESIPDGRLRPKR